MCNCTLLGRDCSHWYDYAEALELFNTLHGTEYSKWHEVSLMPEGDRRDWLAVARKAREMRAEK